MATSFAAAAQAAPRSFAVLSEVAREVFVTSFQEATGTRLGNNIVSKVPIADGALDKVALLAAQKAIAETEPGAKIWMLAPMDSDLFDSRADYSQGAVLALPADLADAMRQRGSTHLLLFTRQRGEIAAAFQHGRSGTGQVEGLGFFVDTQAPVVHGQTLNSSTGYLAPHLYMRATLIDAKTGRVLVTRRIQKSVALVAASSADANHPWNLLKPAEKVQHLSDLLLSELGSAVPPLLAAAQAP